MITKMMGRRGQWTPLHAAQHRGSLRGGRCCRIRFKYCRRRGGHRWRTRVALPSATPSFVVYLQVDYGLRKDPFCSQPSNLTSRRRRHAKPAAHLRPQTPLQVAPAGAIGAACIITWGSRAVSWVNYSSVIQRVLAVSISRDGILHVAGFCSHMDRTFGDTNIFGSIFVIPAIVAITAQDRIRTCARKQNGCT